ncbi:hypothetical protein J4212_03400 [Candidatus Woesearchaeota archaeon]|nr:hypothetical protein [Candidatus Woesearchaeota archaeon]
MSLRLIVKKLELAEKRFITRDEIKKYCKELRMDYYATIRYLISNEYLVTILRGIFYIKPLEERKSKKIGISFIGAITEALRIKGVKNWYFGLESAVKLNNLTHEYFAVETVINDRIFRPKPIEILGTKAKFIKISKSLLKFGLKGDGIKFSDAEKTLLDTVYLGRYNNYSGEEIKNRIAPLLENCKKSRLRKYAAHYPKTVGSFLEGLI